MNPFAALGLSAEIVDALTAQGYNEPTPIQSAAIPKALAGHDVLAAAQTGTGKTAAFMLPSLERLKRYGNTGTSPAMHPVRMLVLTPTRELADQIDENTRSYMKNLPLRHTVIFGGMNMEPQKEALRAGCEIVIATVGRLLDHVGQKNIQLNKVEILVLDEADRMLDMGFIDDIRKIMNLLPKNRQILLFSATFAPEIRRLANDFMRLPQQVEVAPQNAAAKNVEQHVIAVDAFKKRALLERLIVDLNIPQVIVFCKTKISVEQVTRDLQRRKLSAQSLHGDKSQAARLETLTAFKEGQVRVLVATDVAARGLDISELPFVINYEMPTQPEDYVHRIGRTGRAGAEGVALSLMDESEEKMFEAIVKLIDQPLKIEKIEGFEPQWLDAAPTEKSPQRPARDVRRSDFKTEQRNGGERSERAERTERYTERGGNDAARRCDPIPGRKRTLRGRHREVCALLLPNYGIKG